MKDVTRKWQSSFFQHRVLLVHHAEPKDLLSTYFPVASLQSDQSLPEDQSWAIVDSFVEDGLPHTQEQIFIQIIINVTGKWQWRDKDLPGRQIHSFASELKFLKDFRYIENLRTRIRRDLLLSEECFSLSFLWRTVWSFWICSSCSISHPAC